MIRPWYRSLLFWLGLPGLVFLLWGWADSTRFLSILKWQSKGVVLGFQSSGNPLRIDSFHCLDPGRRSDLTFDRFPVSRLPLAVEHPLFPTAVRFGSIHDASNDSTTRMLVIASWMKISRLYRSMDRFFGLLAAPQSPAQPAGGGGAAGNLSRQGPSSIAPIIRLGQHGIMC
jgi:hypothetical protein